MCLVVDTCALSAVFNTQNANHLQFEPVYKWIVFGPGMVVYGGTRYLRELATAERYMKLFVEFGKTRKAVVVSKSAVDRNQTEVTKLEPHPKFNDPHLVAIVRVSGCRVLCTTDLAAVPFLKKQKLYGKAKRPKIYSSSGQKHLLRANNIAPCCRRFAR